MVDMDHLSYFSNLDGPARSRAAASGGLRFQPQPDSGGPSQRKNRGREVPAVLVNRTRPLLDVVPTLSGDR